LGVGGQEMSEKVMEYLTMTRIMEAELEKWKKKQKTFNSWTGIEQLYAEAAFQDGFMAGFSGKYFNTEE
jgi:hypothetical protein